MQIDGEVNNKANTNAVGIDNAPHQRQQEAKAWGGVWWGAGKPSIGQVWTCHFAPAMAACPQPSSLSQFHLCLFLCLYQHCSLSISLSSLNAVKLNSGLGSGLFLPGSCSHTSELVMAYMSCLMVPFIFTWSAPAHGWPHLAMHVFFRSATL